MQEFKSTQADAQQRSEVLLHHLQQGDFVWGLNTTFAILIG